MFWIPVEINDSTVCLGDKEALEEARSKLPAHRKDDVLTKQRFVRLMSGQEIIWFGFGRG